VTKQVVITATPAPDRVQIFWYIGLGAGSQPDQIPLEKAFADKYNKSQTEIQLVPIIVDNKYARDNLTAQVAGGNAPDIVGPVGTAGRMAFPGAFLDLEPLIKEAKYDTSDIDPAFLSFYKDEGKLVGLPFAIFPEFMFVNKALFAEAKLPLPPQKYGDKYTLDGKTYDWNFDTLTMVAKKLTVDKNGADATSAKFDATKIVQYGYVPQWTDHPRAIGSLFGAWYAKDANGNAQIPQTAQDALKWYYDGMYGTAPFIPNKAAMDSDLMKGNAFSSGKVAMATTHLWYTCCIDAKNVPNWDTAIMPSYNGKVTSKMHGDTFAIMAGSKNQKAAFKVYTYMLGEGAPDLYKIYGGLPARKSQQAAFFAGLDKTFAPNKVNWQVAMDSIQYMDVPNHENIATNNYAKIWDFFSGMTSKLQTDPKVDFKTFMADSIKQLDVLLKEKK
jgi:multiple sugar transport system substrate-binding protein